MIHLFLSLALAPCVCSYHPTHMVRMKRQLRWRDKWWKRKIEKKIERERCDGVTRQNHAMYFFHRRQIHHFAANAPNRFKAKLNLSHAFVWNEAQNKSLGAGTGTRRRCHSYQINTHTHSQIARKFPYALAHTPAYHLYINLLRLTGPRKKPTHVFKWFRFFLFGLFLSPVLLFLMAFAA